MAMKLEFNSIKNQSIFQPEFQSFSVNGYNVIEFKKQPQAAGGIAVVYAPNGTGKSSLTAEKYSGSDPIKKLEKEREDLKIAGYWVHCRRRFNDALEVIPKAHRKESILHLIMKQIQAIYREEGKLSDFSMEDRLMQRQLVVKPLVDAFFAYLKQNEPKIPKNGKIREAFTYALNQESYLKVFLEDGDVPIDNNASERAIRGFCIGKKNWEMIDTVNGANSSAIIYSIAETAKANNLKPFDYFEYLLTEIPKHVDEKNTDFLAELLPWSDMLPENIRKPQKASGK